MRYSFADINEEDSVDHFLGKIDLLHPDTASCFLLNGAEQWFNFCDSFTSDCRWEDKASPTIMGEIDLRTGFSSSDSACYRGKVGVGVFENKEAKFEVLNSTIRDSVLVAISAISSDIDQTTDSRTITGIIGSARSDGLNIINTNIGVEGRGSPGKYTAAIRGNATGGENNAQNFGAYLQAFGAPPGRNIGVYTEVANPTDIALYMVGSTVQIGVPSIMISDENFKTDAQLIENPLDKLNQIQTYSYYFTSPDNRPFPFDQEMQYGFMAQQVQESLPHLVAEIPIPEISDSTGFIEGTDMTALGVKYDGFIPPVVAGIKQQSGIIAAQAGMIEAQNAEISELQSQLATQAASVQEYENTISTLQAQVTSIQSQMNNMLQAVTALQAKSAACCPFGSAQASAGESGDKNQKGVELKQNIPNPFDYTTRIAFTLSADARVLLEISDAQGRPLRTLVNRDLNVGNHTITFDGSGLAPGVYYYTLYADGVMISKRMLKI